jgi:hypothetical protein
MTTADLKCYPVTKAPERGERNDRGEIVATNTIPLEQLLAEQRDQYHPEDWRRASYDAAKWQRGVVVRTFRTGKSHRVVPKGTHVLVEREVDEYGLTIMFEGMLCQTSAKPRDVRIVGEL